MSFTEHCDIFCAIHERGINRVVHHIMRQRPSLFNYATELVLLRPECFSHPIDAHPVVIARGNPLATLVEPLPILGSNYGLDWYAQFTAAEVDFPPGQVIGLPPQLNPPLAAQRFAVHGSACAGLGCTLRRNSPVLTPFRLIDSRTSARGTVVLPSFDLESFCLDLFVVADVDATSAGDKWRLQGQLKGLELVDLGPEGLENSIECYARQFIQLVVLPQLAGSPIALTQDLLNAATVTLVPSPVSASIPNNPSLDADQLKVFIDLVTGPPGSTPPAPSGPPAPPPAAGYTRPRVRTGPADATVAISENAVCELFTAFRSGFHQTYSKTRPFGPFSLSCDVEVHLEGGSVELQADGTFLVRELDIKWDKLEVGFGIDIPEFTVGGFCIIPIPFDGCAVRAPEVSVFGDNPDLSFSLDIGGLITSEVSAMLRPLMKYAVNPARPNGMNDWDAKDNEIPNKWQVMIDPSGLDVDVFDIADMVGDLLEDAVDIAIDGVLGGLPDWAKDLVRAILGPAIDLVRGILDFGDDLQEWLSQKLRVDLDIVNFLLTAVADYIAKDKPLIEIEDPLTFMDTDGSRIPVMLPLEFVGVQVNTNEMILEVDIGA